MISGLRGTVLTLRPPVAGVDVQGVGASAIASLATDRGLRR